MEASTDLISVVVPVCDECTTFDLNNPFVDPQDGLPCVAASGCFFFIRNQRLTNAPAWTGSASV
jgi:hypothetical protein